MEERPPVWRVAVNILNKQLWAADRGWSSSLGVDEVLTTRRKKLALLRNGYICLGSGLIV